MLQGTGTPQVHEKGYQNALAEPNKEYLRLQLNGWGSLGEAVGRRDGAVVFASDGLPGEEVVVEIAERRRRFLRGRVVEVLRESPARVKPPCKAFGYCGGCSWQHASYQTQLELKTSIVLSNLERIGGFADPPVSPIVGAVNPWYYRNQVRFSTDSDGRLCFTYRHSRRRLPIDHCHIAQPQINALLPTLQGLGAGLHQVAIRYGYRTSQVAINPLIEAAPLPTGQPAYYDEMLGRRFRVSRDSFFQVNTRSETRTLPESLVLPWLTDLDRQGDFSQADLLALAVLDRLMVQPDDVVLDAYCGVGTFALLIAPYGRRVIAIEESKGAIGDARFNGTDPTVCLPLAENVDFQAGRVEKVLPEIDERIDLAVLDPARSGCAPQTLYALIAAAPRRIVYVSCAPATLARDLKTLCQSAYDLIDVLPIDLFPQTYHVEAVALLEKRAV